ncbi:ATP-binding protein involved in chromosome partitioning [Methylomarinovum tepidoasis]|uniref:Iron-sulfur cluster carrier protein n=1 Tax=Methylomarinovum tepidoasis TaxID=2840183 RepID=A0AAU9CA19_9GAMM|nr:iron-sulfur cluster carrier protein ApbC [Methylomarinovum sp. IN45]BCX88772.1 ATP-binding protein involved in chromosome partitioning [Methylomarinovum sp. IN45]
MTEPSHNRIEAALKTYTDPHLQTDLVSAGAVKSIEIDGGRVAARIELGFPAKSYAPQLTLALSEVLRALEGVQAIDVQVDWKIVPHRVQAGKKPLAGVKNVIAVASGKGGVGKSTVAVNLALALAQEGAAVGILDADIYGPSVPRMLGVAGQPETKDGKTIEPKETYGLKVMSIGLLVEEDTPMIWRGPMATGALQQLLGQTHWGELDYLIVDLPPGTGDIHLTLTQQIPVAGAVIVTTPQDIALLDAMKGLKMFEKVKVPVLGIVENMSLHVCSQCGHTEPVFGEGGGEKMARKYGVPLLGQLPLDAGIREQTDSGRPTVVADAGGPLAARYREIARRAAAQLSLRPKDMAGKFGDIVVEAAR